MAGSIVQPHKHVFYTNAFIYIYYNACAKMQLHLPGSCRVADGIAY